MDKIINLWNKLSGAKTFLGLFLGLVYAAALEAGWTDRNSQIEQAIYAWIAFGVGHKAVKELK